jgi:hypothetical protein
MAKAMTPRLTRRSRRRRSPNGVEGGVSGAGTRGSVATGAEAARQRQWRARTVTFGHPQSVVHVARWLAAAAFGQRLCRNGVVSRRLYDARGRAARAWSMAATRRERADRRARHGKRRLTGGSLMSVISELKFTPR